jgi:hypothetical protein
MKFDEMWAIVEEANPMLEMGTVTMYSALFKKAMRFAFDKGVLEGETKDLYNKFFG